MEVNQQGDQDNQDVNTSIDEISTQASEDTIAYYLPKDELKAITEFREGESAQLPSLQYPINPIFRRQRWVETTDRQWALVEPILRLASAFFESEASFIVLYSIINAPQIRLPRSISGGKDRYEIRRLNPSKHSHVVRPEFDGNIALFGNNIWWRIGDMNPRGGGREKLDWYGRTQRYDEMVFQYSNLERKDITGNGSVVSLNARYWHMLELLESYKSKPNGVSMNSLVAMTLSAHIHMAVTICHELAHVV